MAVVIRRAKIDDSLRVWEIRNDPKNRQGFMAQKGIPWVEHRAWFVNKYFGVGTSTCSVIESDGQVIGYCRLDLTPDGEHVVSIGIDSMFRSKGLGNILLNRVARNHRGALLATIKKTNPGSVRIFEKNDFLLTTEDKENFYYRRERLDSQEFSLLPIPPVLRVEPASACNLKCRHCPTGLGMNDNTGIMTWETFEAIYDKIKDYLFRVIVLYHGGEPLLNKRFFDMVRRLKPLAEKGVETVTNGSVLTDHIIREIIDSGLNQVKISLDGDSVAENDKIRVNSNAVKILERIKALIQTRNSMNSPTPRIMITSVVIPKTIEETATPPKPPQYIVDALGELSQFVEFLTVHSLVWPGMSPLIQLKQPQPTQNYCDHVVNRMTIRWDGTVVPCCYDLTTISPMGNLLEEELADIWNNERYNKLRDDIEAFSPPQLCQGCMVLYPQNYMTKKDIQL